ncbi:HNH endonuclease [Pseudomonas thivervalensis]|uniref:HNH endonuclease n=1 Tax=Pseudomonas thivervalensis TaxID=86265 RepID=UPI00069EE30F|nr:HNH endonuclease [Pseudomonas thivervalensis]
MIEGFINSNAKRREAFFNVYETSISTIRSPEQKKESLGLNEVLIYRYCGKEPPEGKFKEVSHAIPIFLGNKTIIDRLECDNCNHHFGDHLEDSFAKYLNPFRPFQRTRGRSGIPTYKDQDLRISASSQDHVDIYMLADQELSSLQMQGENKLKFVLQRQPYYPVAVHKSLIKIAIAMMPSEDHERLAVLKQWLLMKDNQPIMSNIPVIEWAASGPINPNRIVCMVGKAREEFRSEYFLYTFIFCYANMQYQLIVPVMDEEAGRNKAFVFAPVLLSDSHFRAYGPCGHVEKYLDSDQQVRGESVELLLKYE